MKKFTMRNPPQKPERQIIQRNVDIYMPDFKTVQELIDFCYNLHIPYNQIKIDVGGYYAEDIRFCWDELESDDVFNRRMDKYKQNLKKYNAWYKKNKKQLKEIEKQNITIKKAKEKQEWAKTEIQKQIKELQEKLKVLDK